jgi:hypothetical protein
MVRIVCIIIGIVLPLLTTVSGAEDWSYLAQDKDKKMSLHIDKDSREIVSENILRAWVKYQYQQHFKGKREYDCMKCTPEKLLSYTIAHKEFDCKEKTSRFLQIAEYYTDQTMRTEPLVSTWKDAQPESAEEYLINYVCAQNQ